MGRITIELIRKRAEHNDGEIRSLEELALHQEKLIKIENLDKWCRNLKILLLQNNSISKLENLSRLKCLEYLNVAMNNIELIEGLEGCESLKKLDLTLNFVGKVSSIENLKANWTLEELYLTGNPCSDFKGYREFVLSKLPQLMHLDGVEVSPSERIKARQELVTNEKSLVNSEYSHSELREIQKNIPIPDIDDENFWKVPTIDSPEVRSQIHRKIEMEDKNNSTEKIEKKPKPLRKLFDISGRPFNINEGKYKFSFNDTGTNSVLELHLPKFMDTSLVKLDVQPNFVRAIIKGKIFQFELLEEVKPDSSSAQTSKITGHLVITMNKCNPGDIIGIKPIMDEKIKKIDSLNEIVDDSVKEDDDIPPLI